MHGAEVPVGLALALHVGHLLPDGQLLRVVAEGLVEALQQSLRQA